MACQTVAKKGGRNQTEKMNAAFVPLTMGDVRERLAANMRRLRAARGISQERLALEAGVDRTMLSKIERRISNPSMETLLKLANRLGVDPVALLEPGPLVSLPAGSNYRMTSSHPIAVHEPGQDKSA
ncbi:MAG: hypothetical protein RL322_254 [Pseudomonadota bacterium]